MAYYSFSDKETQCNYYFNRANEKQGPFWHYCTPGHLCESINISKEDYIFSVNNLAISAAEAGIVVVTDAHMENHIHTLIGCKKERIRIFEDAYIYREKKYLSSRGRDVDFSHLKCTDPILITDINMMRNEIAYINRNGYVADHQYMPNTYPWSGGRLYFNPSIQNTDYCPSMLYQLRPGAMYVQGCSSLLQSYF